MELTVRATSIWNEYVRDFPQARVTNVKRQLNWWQEGTFRFPVDDPHADELLLPNEARIYDETGATKLWGPVVARRMDHQSREWEYTMRGPLWYLTRRHVGYLNRPNLAGTNADFESGLTGWVVDGKNSGLCTAVISPRFYLGTQSVGLQGTHVEPLTPDLPERYLRHSFSYTTFERPVTIHATAYSFLPEAAFIEGSYRNRALGLATGNLRRFSRFSYKIFDQWVRHQVALTIPPSTSVTSAQIQLYCPDGNVNWDAVTVWADEAQRFLPGNNPFDSTRDWDQANVFSAIVHGLQGRSHGVLRNPIFPVSVDEALPFTAKWYVSKSDVNIQPAATPTGYESQWGFRLANQRPGYDGGAGNDGVIDQLMRQGPGFDIDIDYDLDPTLRTLVAYSPQKGTTWDQEFLYINEPANTPGSSSWAIVGYTFTDTVAELTTDYLLQNREDVLDIVHNFDVSATGGVTLETAEEVDLTLAELVPSVAVQGQAGAQPQETLTLTIADPRGPDGTITTPVIGVLDVGDTIHVTIVDGGFSRTGDYRIMGLEEKDDNTVDATGVLIGSTAVPPQPPAAMYYGQPLADVSYLTAELVESHTCKLQITADPQLGKPQAVGHAYQRQFFICRDGATVSSDQAGSGYFELQTWASPNAPGALHLDGRRVIVFSIWGGNNAVAGIGPNEGTYPTFAGTGAEVGGSLATVMMDYDWHQGETLTFTLHSTGGPNASIFCFVSGDQHGNTMYLVGEISGIGNGFADTTTVWGWLSHYTRQLDEFYSQNPQADCTGFGLSESVWSHFHANSNLAGGVTDIVADYYSLYPIAGNATQCAATIVRAAVGGDSDKLTMTSGA